MNITGDTTLKEFREKFEDKDFVKKIENLRESILPAEHMFSFDFVMACLLGGTTNGHISISIYRKVSKLNNTWGSNCGKAFEKGFRRIPSELNKYLELIDDNKTINNIKDLLENGEMEKEAIDINKGKSKKYVFRETDGLISAINKIANIDDFVNSNRGEDLSVDKIKKAEDKIKDLIKSGIKQIILTGAPGTGKTYMAKKIAKGFIGEENKEEYIKFVQFHPSYDYTDFVEGLRPVDVDNQVTFRKMDGTFKKFCRKVKANNEKYPEKDKEKYFFIIDEINRADVSKVFGELMFGLEKDKREENIETQYGNLPTYYYNDDDDKKIIPYNGEEDVFKDGFSIPENICIIGTMNDIDRSVESMDFALRRRFNWIQVNANEELEGAFASKDEKGGYILLPFVADKDRDDIVKSIINQIKRLNNYITNEGKKYLLDENYHISHGYFAHLGEFEYENDESKDMSILKCVWNYRLETLISEYVRGENNGKEFVEKCKNEFLKKTDGSGLKDNTNNELPQN